MPTDYPSYVYGIPGYDPVATAKAGEWFDVDAAERAINFFPLALKHVKGALAGTPLKLEEWQKAIIGNLFGWKRADGTRRYREAMVFIPRKNGKTTISAGIALLMLVLDGEPGAEVYSAAADREQAALCFDQAKGMVAQEPQLSAKCSVYQRAITCGASSYKAISAEANTKHGYNAHCVIFDEVHAQPNRDLVDVLATSMGARTQPMMVFITTSDYQRESICNEKHDYACKVRDGIIEDSSFLPVIYEIGVEEDWTDVDVLAKANPNLGISLSREWLEREIARAKETPAYENTFRRLHGNVRTESESRWFSMHRWDACAQDFTAQDLTGLECHGGIDLASTQDISAFVLAFPNEDSTVNVLPWFWLPEESAQERERKNGIPYSAWARDGLINLTPGNSIDHDRLEADILQICKQYNVRSIGYDSWNADALRGRLEQGGMEMWKFPQTINALNEPSKRIETLILNGGLHHNGNAVLRWMASNVTVDSDNNGNIKPSKKKSTEKIDGIVAMVMAMGRVLVAEEDAPSVYEERGVLTL